MLAAVNSPGGKAERCWGDRQPSLAERGQESKLSRGELIVQYREARQCSRRNDER